jgi:hypothetical protein
MASMVYAVESWILALMGWAWLSFQEMWAWSLLSAYVFYGLMLMSTLNVIMCGVVPDSVGPRSAYFGAVLALAMHAAACILDTLPMPQLGWKSFVSPFTESSTCTLAKSNQLFLFNDSALYLAQAGATLAYLVIQLVVSGAALLDSDWRSLWIGPSWGCGLGVLLCGRFISAFDGMAKGLSPQANKYLEIYTLPVAEFAVLLYGFMYLLGILGALEGMLFPGLVWRKSVRYVTLTGVILFSAFTGYALGSKGMLTPSVVALLVLILVVTIVGVVEAALAVSVPGTLSVETTPPTSRPAGPVLFRPYQPPYVPTGVPAWGRPPMARQLRELRHVIPSPVEMLGEKNKAV